MEYALIRATTEQYAPILATHYPRYLTLYFLFVFFPRIKLNQHRIKYILRPANKTMGI